MRFLAFSIMLALSLAPGAASASQAAAPPAVEEQAAFMPPTPERMSAMLKTIPRCAPLPAATSARGGKLDQATSRADRIAEAMRRIQEQFPNTACKEGPTE